MATVAALLATSIAAAPTPLKITANPDRHAYFGDLHLHTTLSFDAYVWMGARAGPEDAYRFARGDVVDFLGSPIRRKWPLDFLAVTDHSENLGVFNQLEDPESELSKSDLGKAAKSGGRDGFIQALRAMAKSGPVTANAGPMSAAAWARIIAAANAYYQPGKFTTFIGYEWSVNPDNQNLHRNIIFQDKPSAAPFSRFDSDKPEALWAWLAAQRKQGIEALAIPHNGNVSNGLMYNGLTSDGKPVDAAWVRLRAANEPLSEITQNKGTSETHPALSPNDEFAGFEPYEWLLAGEAIKSKPQGSYWRQALGRGLAMAQRIGANPYKDGAIGAGDLHSGLPVSGEDEYGGVGKPNLGKGRMTKEQVSKILADAPKAATQSTDIITSSAGLTGVWAESNNRESIYAALRRKETFATSGTRIKVRFFAASTLPATVFRTENWAASAYAAGVPMGGDYAARRTPPVFAIEALKAPESAALERVQVVKLSLVNGEPRERIFNAAIASKGSPQFRLLWRDPSFKVSQAAVYYVRVLEMPTPRWSTLRAREFGLPIPKERPALIQERAWTSPIWVTPRPIASYPAAHPTRLRNDHALDQTVAYLDPAHLDCRKPAG